MEVQIGEIYGDIKTTEFVFKVNDRNIRKFDYIACHHKEGVVLSCISDLERHKDGSLSASARVIGYRTEQGYLQVLRTPFELGCKVVPADKSLIRAVLGLHNKSNGAYIGLLEGSNICVYLDINSMIQKHICILAKTNGGKSYTCGVLVEEFLKKKVPIVIIDTQGEYISLGTPNKNKKDTKKFHVKPHGYSEQIIHYSTEGDKHLVFEIEDIIKFLGLTNTQKGILYQGINVKKYKKIQDIINAVNQNKNNAKWDVIRLLESLDSINIFSKKSMPSNELVKEGKCSIIDMKGIPLDIQKILVACLTTQLFADRKAEKISPFLLIVEEAHNYCPERGFGTAVSSNILRTVASEGRALGMGICIISQRPAKVDKNIISQCNTNIILKVTNPNDLKAIIDSVEGSTSQTYDEIQSLPVGYAIISDPSIQIPIKVDVRVRETEHGGHSINFFKKRDKSSSFLTEEYPIHKANTVHRVISRLGWIETNDPYKTISILLQQAKKENKSIYEKCKSIEMLGEKFCHEQDPDCIRCPMMDYCRKIAE